MPRKELYLGFDPTFIDINILPHKEENTELINELPPLGAHHVNTSLEFRPGGNGFNVSRTLASLGNRVTYVGASNRLFESLVAELQLPISIMPIVGASVNYTAILNFQKGEVQFNSIKGKLAPNHLNERIVRAYSSSLVKPISNVALNPTSIEWVTSLLLVISSVDHPLIYENIPYIEKLQKLRETTYEGIIFIDPCDISHFNRIHDFVRVLQALKMLEGEKWLSVNEYELRALIDSTKFSPAKLTEKINIPIILHTAQSVKVYGKKALSFDTKKLRNTVTFVGAGDCFNGGFLNAILKGNAVHDAIKFAIQCATHLIETGKYPTFKI